MLRSLGAVCVCSKPEQQHRVGLLYYFRDRDPQRYSVYSHWGEYRASCKQDAWEFFEAMFLDEVSVEELRRRFGVTEAVVYTRRLRALRKLRELAKRWMEKHQDPT